MFGLRARREKADAAATERAQDSAELKKALREIQRQARITRVNSTTLRHVARVQELARGIAERAAHLTGAPAGAVNLVFGDHMHTAAGFNIDETDGDLDASYCWYVVEQGRPLSFDSTLDEPELRRDSATQNNGYRSYFGVPLVTQDGYIIGALCVYDFVPRVWGQEDAELLTGLAAELMNAEAPRQPDLYPPGRRR